MYHHPAGFVPAKTKAQIQTTYGPFAPAKTKAQIQTTYGHSAGHAKIFVCFGGGFLTKSSNLFL